MENTFPKISFLKNVFVGIYDSNKIWLRLTVTKVAIQYTEDRYRQIWGLLQTIFKKIFEESFRKVNIQTMYGRLLL